MTMAGRRTGRRSPDDEDFYPESDGRPMGETDQHVGEMMYCIASLGFHFADRPDVYVAGNNFLYYERGNPRAVVSPDCYVVFGVPKYKRRTYLLWKEGITPSVVVEITSKKTRREDVNKKRPIYEQKLGVAEYFQFDPTGDYLTPRLQGLRLENGVYVPLPLEGDRIYSAQLDLYLVVMDDSLRFYDPKTGRLLRTYAEAETEAGRAEFEAERADAEAKRAEAETERAEAAEAEVARLRAEIEALRKKSGS